MRTSKEARKVSTKVDVIKVMHQNSCPGAQRVRLGSQQHGPALQPCRGGVPVHLVQMRRLDQRDESGFSLSLLSSLQNLANEEVKKVESFRADHQKGGQNEKKINPHKNEKEGKIHATVTKVHPANSPQHLMESEDTIPKNILR